MDTSGFDVEKAVKYFLDHCEEYGFTAVKTDTPTDSPFEEPMSVMFAKLIEKEKNKAE